MFVSLVLHCRAVCTCGVALQESPTWPSSTWPSAALMPGVQRNDFFVAAIVEALPTLLTEVWFSFRSFVLLCAFLSLDSFCCHLRELFSVGLIGS